MVSSRAPHADGGWLALFSSSLGVIDSNEAELRVICHALVILRNSKWREYSLVIESDSLVAVFWVLHYKERPWKLWSWFRRIDNASKGGVDRSFWFQVME
ncbi:hypothetical protein GQ457_04G025890 [Hibiscus cannabinus]